MGSSFFVADASRLGRKDGAWGFSGVYFSAVPTCNKSATSSHSLYYTTVLFLRCLFTEKKAQSTVRTMPQAKMVPMVYIHTSGVTS